MKQALFCLMLLVEIVGISEYLFHNLADLRIALA